MKWPFVHCLMCCLFTVSSWFVQSASLTNQPQWCLQQILYNTSLNIDWYMSKDRSLLFSGSINIPILGPTVQLETRQASFPTGMVGPRVGIFLSPLNTKDGFYLSYPHYLTPGSHMRMVHWLYWNSRSWSFSDVIVICLINVIVSCCISAYWEPFLNMNWGI